MNIEFGFSVISNFLAPRSGSRVAYPRNFARVRLYFARPTIAISKIRAYSQSSRAQPLLVVQNISDSPVTLGRWPCSKTKMQLKHWSTFLHPKVTFFTNWNDS